MSAHAKASSFVPEPIRRESFDTFGQARADGSMVITAEQLARIGNGDPKRGRRELRLMLAAERDRTMPPGPVEKPVSVRVAGPQDEAALLALIRLDLEENAVRVAPIDDARVLERIQVGTRRKGGIVGVIDGPDHRPVATCLVVPDQWWWSQSYYLAEAINFVHPDHRRSRHIDDLLKFERWVADEWTRSFGYRVYMTFAVLGTKRVREKVMLYRRKFPQTGAFFLYPSPFAGE